MELDDKLKAELIATAQSLKGSERRMFMARTVKMLGPGGQRLAERELGWNRATIRKGMRELERGVTCLDGTRLRGRKPVEARLPNLLHDLRDLIETWRRAHPECRNDARASASGPRHRLRPRTAGHGALHTAAVHLPVPYDL